MKASLSQLIFIFKKGTWSISKFEDCQFFFAFITFKLKVNGGNLHPRSFGKFFVVLISLKHI